MSVKPNKIKLGVIGIFHITQTSPYMLIDQRSEVLLIEGLFS